jgi:hypothetical protein
MSNIRRATPAAVFEARALQRTSKPIYRLFGLNRRRKQPQAVHSPYSGAGSVRPNSFRENPNVKVYLVECVGSSPRLAGPFEADPHRHAARP